MSTAAGWSAQPPIIRTAAAIRPQRCAPQRVLSAKKCARGLASRSTPELRPACLPGARFGRRVVLKPRMRWRAPMEIVPLGPGFAAEVRGVNIQDVVASAAAYTAVRAVFEEHSVLVLREQDV